MVLYTPLYPSLSISSLFSGFTCRRCSHLHIPNGHSKWGTKYYAWCINNRACGQLEVTDSWLAGLTDMLTIHRCERGDDISFSLLRHSGTEWPTGSFLGDQPTFSAGDVKNLSILFSSQWVTRVTSCWATDFSNFLLCPWLLLSSASVLAQPPLDSQASVLCDSRPFLSLLATSFLRKKGEGNKYVPVSKAGGWLKPFPIRTLLYRQTQSCSYSSNLHAHKALHYRDAALLGISQRHLSQGSGLDWVGSLWMKLRRGSMKLLSEGCLPKRVRESLR